MSRKNSKVKSRSSSVSDGDQSGPTLAEMREQEIQRKERDLQQKIRSEMQVEMMAGVEAKLNGMMEKFMERFAQASLSQQVNEPNRASAIPRAYPSAFPSSSSSSMPSARHNDNADFGYQQFRAQGAAVSSDSKFEQGYDFEGNPIRVKNDNNNEHQSFERRDNNNKNFGRNDVLELVTLIRRHQLIWFSSSKVKFTLNFNCSSNEPRAISLDEK